MRKRPLFMGACLFVTGLLFAAQQSRCAAGLFALMLLYAVSYPVRKRQWKRALARTLWMMGLFCAAVLHMSGALAKRQAELSQIHAGDTLLLCGSVYKKELKNGAYQYYLKNCVSDISGQQVACNQVMVFLDADSDSCSIGETLVVKGKVNMFEKPVNEGQFDAFSFYASQQIDFSLREAQVVRRSADGNCVNGVLYHMRQRTLEVYEAYLDEAHAGVLGAMLLGEKSSLDGEIKELYQNAGISHILSISGMHASLVGMALYRFLRKRGISYRSAFAVAFPVLYLYGVMTGSSVSARRAIGMLALFMAAEVCGRGYDMLNALGAVVLLLLYENPFWLWYSGFLFSVAAIAGIGVFVAALPVRGGKKTFSGGGELADGVDMSDSNRNPGWRKLLGTCVNALYGSIGIWLVTLPLVAWNYYEIPTYSFLLNLFILPFLKPLFLFGISGGLLGDFAGMASLKGMTFFEGMSAFTGLLFLPCKVILGAYERLAEFFMALPASCRIVGKPSPERIAVYYMALLLAGALCRKLADKHTVRWMGFAVLLLILLVPAKRGFEVDVLDVGQGDGIYICTQDKTSLFIDGGSSNVRRVGKYRILPFLKSKGVSSIDFWFVTHPDSDHISGLLEVLDEGYRINYLVVAKAALRSGGSLPENDLSGGEPSSMEKLIKRAEENGTEVIALKAGDMLVFSGDLLTCLYPAAEEHAADANALSLVLLYESDVFKGIFTGDISSEKEREILAAYGDVLADVDFYKVAHHGSRYSNSEALLYRLSPKFAAISCSSTNSYGHPHRETLERLKETDAQVYRTDECGQIAVKSDGRRIWVKPFLEEKDETR